METTLPESSDTHPRILKINGWLIFAILSILYLLDVFLRQKFVLVDQIYYGTYGERLAIERIEGIIQLKKSVEWVSYLMIFPIMILRIAFTTFCLNVGALFSEQKVKFTQLFKLALTAEFIFLFGQLFYTFLLLTVVEPTSLEDVVGFAPLSLLEVFKPVAPYFDYPLRTLNIFEVLYWFFLAWGLGKITQTNFPKGFAKVMSSYGIGLLVWVVFSCFLLILSMS